MFHYVGRLVVDLVDGSDDDAGRTPYSAIATVQSLVGKGAAF